MVFPVAGAGLPLPLLFWFARMLATALFFIIMHLRCRQSYRIALPLKSAYVTAWQQGHTTRRAVRIRQSDRISTPLTYGILRPVVLLPKSMDFDDTRQLEYVLLHEFTHIRRFDVLIKWLLAASLCIHWFNPIVWIMYGFASRDIEISCDETVVKTLGQAEKSAYALTPRKQAHKRYNLFCDKCTGSQ